MRRHKVLTAFVSVAAFLAVATVSGAADLDFTLVNATGVEIHQLNVSPASADEWEEDILGDTTLPDGVSVDVQFAGGSDACLWDIRVIDGEGVEIYWEGINLCEVSRVTLLFEEGEPTAELE